MLFRNILAEFEESFKYVSFACSRYEKNKKK